MENYRKRRNLMAEINVVPYIDVMLVLLVIFMITAPLLTQGVKVKLPQASASTLDRKQQEPIIVTVDNEGRYFLNVGEHPNQAVDAVTLQNRIAAEIQLSHQQQQERQVLVKGDEGVAYGKVIIAMVLLQQAGVVNVGLMTDPPPAAKT